jgi:predicted DNA-binding transcriptional regulator AlpA
MSETYLRFKDLQVRGIVVNWQTLKRWIRDQGFPPGVLLGPNTRAWPETEVNEWLANRPAAYDKKGGAS